MLPVTTWDLKLELHPEQHTEPKSDCFRYKEGDLNVGENSCVDRCSSKYWQVGPDAMQRGDMLPSH